MLQKVVMTCISRNNLYTRK